MTGPRPSCPCGVSRRYHPTPTCDGSYYRTEPRERLGYRGATLKIKDMQDLVDSEPRVARSEDAPRKRSDCKDGQRPCPWLGCKHHLYLEVKPNGSIKLNFPDKDWDELDDTCSLDVADRGPQQLELIARLINVTRERVRQEAIRALYGLSGIDFG